MVTDCSPHPRGWSRPVVVGLDLDLVLPAAAGMVPQTGAYDMRTSNAARTRGDGPSQKARDAESALRSPQPRGWLPSLISGRVSGAAQWLPTTSSTPSWEECRSTPTRRNGWASGGRSYAPALPQTVSTHALIGEPNQPSPSCLRAVPLRTALTSFGYSTGSVSNTSTSSCPCSIGLSIR